MVEPVRRSQVSAVDPTEVGQSPSEVIQGVVTTLLVLGFASGVALALSPVQRAGEIVTVFMSAVLVSALMFGLLHALLAAFVAQFIVFAVFKFAPHSFSVTAPGVLLLLVFGAGVVATGQLTDVIRRRARLARSLMAAGAPLSPHASGSALGEFLSRANPEGLREGAASLLEEGLRTFTALIIVGAGLVAAVLARSWVGPTAAVLCICGAVVVVAGALGGRFGFASATFAAIVQHGHFDRLIGLGQGFEAAFELAALAGLGLGVGVLADRLQRERAALTTLATAGRDLSAKSEEADIRQVLMTSLTSIGPGVRIQIADDVGGPTMKHALAGAPVWSDNDPRWRVRRLEADGRDVGVVRWRFAGVERQSRDADEVAISLIDLGASAIVRARLNLEKGDMEFAARTEQLRLILLDAVSHHFRSPLTGILGSVTSILSAPEGQDPAAQREFLLIIKEQANRLSRYVDSFLSVARLESGSIDVTLADVDVESVVDDVWESFGEAGGSRRFLQVEIEAGEVRTDARLLSQVLGNVLENAIKYSPEGSVVDVKGRRRGEAMVIQVVDEGPGVPEDSQDRIFDRFFRSRGAKAPGLGLGLYITRSLVEILGGGVEARNRTDGKSGFQVSITLPLSEPAK